MDFSEALLLLKQGKRVRRKLWTGKYAGNWIELVSLYTVTDGRELRPTIMSWVAEDGLFYIWGGINFDILADDWELVG